MIVATTTTNASSAGSNLMCDNLLLYYYTTNDINIPCIPRVVADDENVIRNNDGCPFPKFFNVSLSSSIHCYYYVCTYYV